MSDSIRKAILNYLEEHLKGVVQNKPEADPYRYTFGNVRRGKLANVEARKRTAIGIVTGTERKNQRQNGSFSHDDPRLEVYIEWRVTINAGENGPDLAEDFLTDLQRRMGEDETLGGLCISVDELSNEINTDNPEDKTVEGVILYMVTYRHSRYDPRVVI